MTNKVNKEIVRMIEDLNYEVLEIKNENIFVISKNDVNLELYLSEEQIKDDLKYYKLKDNETNRKIIIVNEICYVLENIIEWKAEIFGVGVNDEEMEKQQEEIIRYQKNLREIKNQTIELK